MLVVDQLSEMLPHVGTEIGVSDWVTIDQARIDMFAEATGDHQWIHVDVERAAREQPGGKTIAHGFLVLSLIPQLMYRLFSVTHRKRGLNYGLNRVRFTSPVPVGSRLRLRMRLKEAVPVDGNGMRFTWEDTLELEGSERPACVAEFMTVIYE